MLTIQVEVEGCPTLKGFQPPLVQARPTSFVMLGFQLSAAPETFCCVCRTRAQCLLGLGRRRACVSCVHDGVKTRTRGACVGVRGCGHLVQMICNRTPSLRGGRAYRPFSIQHAIGLELHFQGLGGRTTVTYCLYSRYVYRHT